MKWQLLAIRRQSPVFIRMLVRTKQTQTQKRNYFTLKSLFFIIETNEEGILKSIKNDLDDLKQNILFVNFDFYQQMNFFL